MRKQMKRSMKENIENKKILIVSHGIGDGGASLGRVRNLELWKLPGIYEVDPS